MMSFAAIAPEAWIAGGVLLVVLLEALRPWVRGETLAFAIPAAAMLALGLSSMSAAFWTLANQGIFFEGTLVVDPLSRLLVITVSVVALLVVIYSMADLARHGLGHGEYYALLLTATLGILAIVTGASVLVLFLGLELLSLSLYALISIDRERVIAAEAAMKYFFLGAVASGIFLYGLSLLYGLGGTLSIETLPRMITGLGGRDDVLFLFAGAFVIVAIAFKFGAAPFHMWVPDVYEGAPTPITLLVATVPELGAIALVVRLLVMGLGPLTQEWMPILLAVALLSLLVGNLAALTQSNFKRLLAYSAISHVGFILLGITTGTRAGVVAAVYYTIIYVSMTLVAFGILLALRARGRDIEDLDDLAGLSQIHPGWSLLMLFAMFSLAGVPPFVGFWAKLAILRALLGQGEVVVAVFAVIMAVVGAFYYLRVVKIMYFDRVPNPKAVSAPWGVAELLLAVNGILLLVMGFVPDSLWQLCAWAFHH